MTALVQISKHLINGAQDRVAEIEFTHMWTNDRRLERPEYLDLGRAMVKAGLDLILLPKFLQLLTHSVPLGER